jgi:hypothetical protein
MALYVPVGVLIYAILALDFQVLAILATITILQMPIRRSQTCIDLVNKYIQPMKYFKNF